MSYAERVRDGVENADCGFNGKKTQKQDARQRNATLLAKQFADGFQIFHPIANHLDGHHDRHAQQ